MNTSEIKQIIARFLKVKPEAIENSTLIDKRAIPGSILLHRMFSALSQAGFKVKNINNIVTYADLITRLSNTNSIEFKESPTRYKKSNIDDESVLKASTLGIDMEASENLPDCDDYYGNQFYVDNFSTNEIAYCSSKGDPKSCFTGRFAAKEAIVKADNNYKSTLFSEIEIKISESGQPVFKDMDLSISHVDAGNTQLSIAIAQKTTSSFDKVAADMHENILNDNEYNKSNYSKKDNAVYKRNKIVNLLVFLSLGVLANFFFRWI